MRKVAPCSIKLEFSRTVARPWTQLASEPQREQQLDAALEGNAGAVDSTAATGSSGAAGSSGGRTASSAGGSSGARAIETSGAGSSAGVAFDAAAGGGTESLDAGNSDSGGSVCSDDRQGVTLSNCMQPSAQCREAVCVVDACVTRDKPSTAPCAENGGRYCDGAGTCVYCRSDGDCSSGAPKCNAQGRCVECLSTSHCDASAHEICQGESCVAGPYCGDGARNGSEPCDPTAPGWNAFSCSMLCQRVTNYTTCQTNADCLDGTVCAPTKACGNTCSTISDCNSVAGFSGLDVQCPAPLGTVCVVRCMQTADCPPGTTCNGAQVCAGP